MSYTKLFSEIVLSTIWREPNHIRILWITMLALRNQYHRVEASIPGLADAARITMDECEEGLEALSSPDEYSRSQDFEGRRIEKCDGGWFILNGEKYRNKMNAEERRTYKTEKQREYRAKANPVDTSVDKSVQSGHSRAEQSKAKKEKKRRFAPPSLKEVHECMVEKGVRDKTEAQRFIDFYDSNGWKVGNNKMQSWKGSVGGWISRGVKSGSINKPEPDRIPTWKERGFPSQEAFKEAQEQHAIEMADKRLS